MKTRPATEFLGPLIRLRGRISRHLGRSRERKPSAGISSAVEPLCLGEGSGRLEEIGSARGRARWRAGRQAQVGEDSDHHRGIFDRSDDLQAAAALWAVFDVDIEDAFEQARPTHARGRRLRMGVIGWLPGCVL